MSHVETSSTEGASRRSLLKTAGVGAAALGALAASARLVPARAATVQPSDVLNFALNLEYLEAEFYLRATTGQGLPAQYLTGTGTQGSATGGRMVPFTHAKTQAIANDIASDEFAHVKFLRSALGSAAVAQPTIDLVNSFTTLARAAGIVGPTATFDPYASETNFLLAAYVFEDVGVSAYSGAAGYLTGELSLLAAAAGILAVEAYHGGTIRTQLIQGSPAVYSAADKISALRATLSGAADDVGPFDFKTATVSITDSDSNSIAFARTPQQVLNVVYGNTKGTAGLFFPDKLNGNIS